MLDPQTRRLLLESLRPPPGYQLDHGIGTTFSLDLHALLTAPLAFTFFDWEDKEEKPTSDPLALLESVRRNAERLSIFCQAGQIHVPKKQERLFAYLENSVIEVTPHQGNGVFHPKIWLLRFVSADGPVQYRLLCLSRNLTFDRSWDTALVLEGTLMERQRAFSINHPLGDFIEALPTLATRQVTAGTQKAINLLSSEVRKVQFDLPPDFEEIRFWPLGLKRQNSSQAFYKLFNPGHRRMLVVSPFLSEGLLQKLAEKRKNCILVTRLEEAQTIKPKYLDLFEKTYVFSPDANQEGTEQDETHDRPDSLSGLHAKLFVMDDGWKSRIWTGSANVTDAAFGSNIEFLVEMKSRLAVCGIEKLLEEKGETSFRNLLYEYTPLEEPVQKEETLQKMEELVEEARRSLARARLIAEISAQEEGKGYHLQLNGGPVSLPSEVSARCWPVTLSPAHAENIIPTEKACADFGTVSTDALTAFYAFEIEARTDGEKLQSRFVLNLDLVGAPADRLDCLLRSILENKSQVLRLLFLLLADQEMPLGPMESLDSMLGGDAKGGHDLSGIPLLESLLRALDRSPEKLDRIQRLIDDLEKSSEGKDLLPDGLTTLWPSLWEVRMRMQNGL